MPNTTPPVNTVEVFADKVELTKRVQGIDIRCFFGAQKLSHLEQLRELWTADEHKELKACCPGLKLFLEHSTGNLKVEDGVIDKAFRLCGELGIPLVAHCEDPTVNAKHQVSTNDVAMHSLMRPPESEASAIRQALVLVREYNTPFHVAHITTKEGVDAVRDAKAEGLSVTCEATPHHLFLTVEDYAQLGALAKMNPPLREPVNQRALWEGICDHTIDCVASDHAPHLLRDKRKANVSRIAAGVPGVETSLALLLTVANGTWPNRDSSNNPLSCIEQFSLSDIRRLCFEGPNKVYRLGVSDKALIKVDTSHKWTIAGSDLHSGCGWTPYEGWEVTGKVIV